jgi:hypothetical protein
MLNEFLRLPSNHTEPFFIDWLAVPFRHKADVNELETIELFHVDNMI